MNSIPIDDHDRDRTARLLQEQVGAGRLSLTEFDQRAARAYAAQTRDELESLVADLPVTPPRPVAPGRSRPIVASALSLLAVALVVAGVAGAPALLIAAGVCAAMACCHRGVTTRWQQASGPGASCCR